jgi:hypothetical protein
MELITSQSHQYKILSVKFLLDIPLHILFFTRLIFQGIAVSFFPRGQPPIHP